MTAIFKSKARRPYRLGWGVSKLKLRCCGHSTTSRATNQHDGPATAGSVDGSAEAVKKTAKLTIETERVLVIRKRGGSRRAMCPVCGEMVDLLTVDEAAAFARISSRAVFRLVEAEGIHFTETVEEVLLICLNSLWQNLLSTEIGRVKTNSEWKEKNHESQD